MRPGKVLALDWGAVRCGWALSDPTHTLAGRSGVHRQGDQEQNLTFLRRLIEAEGVSEIVLGLPRNMDGTLGPQAQLVLQLRQALAARFDLPVRLMDERLTSAEAERVLVAAGLSRRRRKAKRDALAATLILQAFLDRRRGQP